MEWKVNRNGESDYRKITCSGVSKQFGKRGEVTLIFNGSLMRRMNMQIYYFVGYESNLREEIGY